jgi:hypothetical protein
MVKELESVRTAFERAMGPFRKRKTILEVLKEAEVGKGRRSVLAEEAAGLDKQWVEAVEELRRAIDACPQFSSQKKE